MIGIVPRQSASHSSKESCYMSELTSVTKEKISQQLLFWQTGIHREVAIIIIVVNNELQR
jgi:hypothetical protein